MHLWSTAQSSPSCLSSAWFTSVRWKFVLRLSHRACQAANRSAPSEQVAVEAEGAAEEDAAAAAVAAAATATATVAAREHMAKFWRSDFAPQKNFAPRSAFADEASLKKKRLSERIFSDLARLSHV